MSRQAGRALRVFIADASGANWTELTSGARRAVRVTAPDLQSAQRAGNRVRADSDDVAVILDVTVLVADDFRSARMSMAELRTADEDTMRYAGTLDGLAGLVGDIFSAGVAEGVTLIPAAPHTDVRALADAVVARISARLPVARAA